MSFNLTHLKQLEAVSIHIIREVVTEFKNPVMLYSIGKDSSVMVHLALKAFYPAKPPFPLLHVDTTWKFQEMYAFRENYAQKELGLEVIRYVNEEGRKLGIDPMESSGKHTTIMKTSLMQHSAELDGTKRSRGPRKGSFHFAINSIDGTQKISVQNYGISTTRESTKGKVFACFPSPTGQNLMSGNTSTLRRFP